MKKITYLLVLLTLINLGSYAQSKAEKQVSEAVITLKNALISGNKAELESIASDNLSYGHSSGKIQDKTAFVEAIVSGQSDFVSIDLSEQTIKVSGKTAIVRHRLSAQTNDGGKPGNVNLLILLIFQKEHGQWKLLARQAIKPPVAS